MIQLVVLVGSVVVVIVMIAAALHRSRLALAVHTVVALAVATLLNVGADLVVARGSVTGAACLLAAIGLLAVTLLWRRTGADREANMRRGRGWTSGALLLVVGIAAGCSAVGKAPEEAGDRAKSLAPPEGKALVYIVRPAGLGKAIGMPVTCDGTNLGKTGGGRFIYAILDPGSHLFISSAENKSELPLVLEAGKTYYLEQKVSMGLMKARNKLVRLEDGEGRERLNKCALSVETAGEPAPPSGGKE